MSTFIGIATTAEVALTGASEKTVLQIVAPANHRLKILSWSIFFDGTSVAAQAAVIKLLRQTDAGTMSALTLVKSDNSLAETLQATAQHTATIEPSADDILARKNVHPQTGYEKIFPLGQEPIVGGGDRIGIAITAPADVNVIAEIVYEE